MEHYLSLFVKSIFVENLALAFFLGMCTFLAVSKNVKNRLRSWLGSHCDPDDHSANEQCHLPEYPERGVTHPQFRARIPGSYLLHRHDCRDGANPRNDPGSLLSLALQQSRNLPPANHRELCDFRRHIVYGRT